MALDPAAPFPLVTEDRTASRLAAIERRVERLERGAPLIQAAAGAPTTEPRDGAPYIDKTTVRLYLRVNGAWRYVALT